MNICKDDFRMLWQLTTACNLQCAYCIMGENRMTRDAADHEIDADAFLASLKEKGKRFHLLMTGGEPFLVPNIIDICATLSRDHRISLNTNLTSPKIAEFISTVNTENIALVIASFHPDELERTGLFDRYLDNYRLLRQAGIAVQVIAVAYPPLTPRVEHYRALLKREGIALEFNPLVGSWNGKMYPESYTNHELETFQLSLSQARIYFQKNNYCNAGYNIAAIFANGDITPCFNLTQKRLGSVSEGFTALTSVERCRADRCVCPLSNHDPRLFLQALYQSKKASFIPVLIALLWQRVNNFVIYWVRRIRRILFGEQKVLS